MKKILSILFIIMILGQNAAFAAEDIKNIKPIDCTTDLTDNLCGSIEINKSEIKLRSYLKDGGILRWRDESGSHVVIYKAYNYKIKNNSSKMINIKEIKGESPYSIIKEAIPLRIQYQLLGLAATPICALTVVGIVVIPYIVFMEVESVALAPFRDTAAIIESIKFKKYNFPIELKPDQEFKVKIFIPKDKVEFIFEEGNKKEYLITK